MYGSNSLDVHMPLEIPNFWVSTNEYIIGLLSMRQGNNVARLNTRTLESLWGSRLVGLEYGYAI